MVAINPCLISLANWRNTVTEEADALMHAGVVKVPRWQSPTPFAARTCATAFDRQVCRASPCTGQEGCSYMHMLRQRPREGAPCHRSRLPLPPTAGASSH